MFSQCNSIRFHTLKLNTESKWKIYFRMFTYARKDFSSHTVPYNQQSKKCVPFRMFEKFHENAYYIHLIRLFLIFPKDEHPNGIDSFLHTFYFFKMKFQRNAKIEFVIEWIWKDLIWVGFLRFFLSSNRMLLKKDSKKWKRTNKMTSKGDDRVQFCLTVWYSFFEQMDKTFSYNLFWFFSRPLALGLD